MDLGERLTLAIAAAPLSGSLGLIAALIAAAREKRMPQDHQSRFSLGSGKGSFEPLPLPAVHTFQHSGIDGDQRETFRLHVEESATLPARADAEFAAQLRGFLEVTIDAALG